MERPPDQFHIIMSANRKACCGKSYIKKVLCICIISINWRVMCHHINQNWVLCLSQVVVLLIKEGRVLFNDALNTFYLWLYGVGHIVKNHSDSERGNPLPPLRLFFLNSSKGSFYMHHPTNRIAHTMVFVTPVVEHWLEREIAQWVHHEGSIQRPIAPWACW